MSIDTKSICDQLMAAHREKRAMPFVVKSGPITVVVDDEVDLVLNAESFRRLTAMDDAEASGLMGAVTR